MTQVLCFDPTSSDSQSKVRGVGRYLQILKENFPEWTFSNTLHVSRYTLHAFINPFFNFLQKPLTLKRIAKKQIAVIHDLIPLKYPSKFPAGLRGNFNILLNKLALKKYDLIVTDSEASKKDIIQILKIPEEKVRVIYPCLPKVFKKVSSSKYQVLRKKTKKEKPLTSYSLLLNTNFCLYVGDATWNKNLVNLARAVKIANVTCVFVGKIFELLSSPKDNKIFAASQLSEQVSEPSHLDSRRRGERMVPRLNYNFWRGMRVDLARKFSLSTFSHPWQKELKEFFQLIKDDKRFIFLGYVADKDLIKLYQQASLNILPSRDEGFGFSYLEASSQGCPSVLSDIPVFKEIAKDSSLFANPENPNDLADKIIELYFDKNRQKTLGDAAKKRSQFFSCEKFKKSFLEIID
jgi:glycosyltransferase involved in cell wall biosynthesis